MLEKKLREFIEFKKSLYVVIKEDLSDVERVEEEKLLCTLDEDFNKIITMYKDGNVDLAEITYKLPTIFRMCI